MTPHFSSPAPVTDRGLSCLVYYCGRMGRRRLLPVWLLLIVSAAGAVENSSQAFTIIRAEQRTRDRVVYWVVNTPLYHEDPYFEVEVRLGNVLLTGEQEPRHASEILPKSWTPSAVVRGRMERRNLYLRSPNGTDLKFVIVKRTHAPTEQ